MVRLARWSGQRITDVRDLLHDDPETFDVLWYATFPYRPDGASAGESDATM